VEYLSAGDGTTDEQTKPARPTSTVRGMDYRKGKDDTMMVLAIAAGTLIATWIVVLLGSQLLGPR
jgi:hypothetical protein